MILVKAESLGDPNIDIRSWIMMLGRGVIESWVWLGRDLVVMMGSNFWDHFGTASRPLRDQVVHSRPG